MLGIPRMLVIVLIFMLYGTICSSREPTGISLLKGEEVVRTNHTIPGCWLGGEFYLLGQRWSPVIEPYGLMICVKCQCASVVRKNIVQQEGKVMCRNIKYECPEPRCSDPILRPNTCCKVCRNQGPHFEDSYTLVQDDMLPPENMAGLGVDRFPDMSALLVGRHYRGHVSIRTRAVALLHVSIISDNSFHYVIRFTRLRHPERILLMDKFGTIFQEKYIPPQKDKHGKLCGVWQDIPPVYMQYIVQGRIYVTIGTKSNKYGEISGKLVEDSGARKATFQGLLAPTRKTGAGGKFDIIYDVISRAATFSIQIENLRQTGLGVNDYFVTMEKDREVAFQRVIRSTGTDQLLTGKIRLDNEMSRRMARSRVYVRVTSRSGETIRGVVQPRLSCNYDEHTMVYMALVYGVIKEIPFQFEYTECTKGHICSVFHRRTYITSLKTSSGDSENSYAVVQITEDSSLRYKIEVSHAHTNVREIILTRLNVNRSLWKTMAIITHTYRHSQTDGGQAVGEYHKMRAIDTYSLLAEEVFASIKLHNSPDELRGRLIEMPYIDHIDIFKDRPFMMSSATCDLTVYIWLVVDTNCYVRYHIMTSRMDDTIAKITVKLTSTVYWKKHTTQNITEYVFDKMSGIIKVIPESVFTSLQFGDNFIDVSIPDLEGCRKMRISLFRPNNCWSHAEDDMDGIDENSIETGGNSVFRCYHNGQFYSHGESWQPTDHDCFTCRCQRGNVICDKVLCPPSNCTKTVTSTGQCCPVCEDENSTEKKPIGSCYFSGDKRWHPYGTTWHPYIPPLGYSKCAICSCIPGSAEVNCSRLPCPELDCPQSQRIRRNPDDCCQECRVRNPQSNSFISCDFGDRFYNHGENWHPSLTPFGEMKCYICRCKHGETKCRKIQCKPLQCANKYRPDGQCCPVCLTDVQNRRRSKQVNRRRSQRPEDG